MPGPLAIPVAIAGSAGVAKISSAVGLLAAGGGAAYYLRDKDAPEMLIKLLLATADMDTTPVKNFGKDILDSARDIKWRGRLIEILAPIVREVASSGIAILLMDWLTGLFTNEESDEAVSVNANDCSTAVEEINRQCGDNIDAGGARLLAIVESLMAELATIDKAQHPEAYQQCLNIIADVIAEYCAIAGEEILDRDETMGQCLDLLVQQVEEEASRDLGVRLPGAVACAPQQCATPAPSVSAPPVMPGSSSPGVAATDVGTAPVSVASPPASTAPVAPGVPAVPPVPSVPTATVTGSEIGAQVGAAAASFLEHLSTAAASSSLGSSMDAAQNLATTPAAAVLETCAQAVQQPQCGPVAHASAAGVGNIVGMIAAEVDKAVHQAATDAQSAIEQFKNQAAAAVAEFCAASADASCEAEPSASQEQTAEPETVPAAVEYAEEDCPPEENADVAESTTVPAGTASQGFDKADYKEQAQADAAVEDVATAPEIDSAPVAQPAENPPHQVDKQTFVGSAAASTSTVHASVDAASSADQREAGSW